MSRQQDCDLILICQSNVLDADGLAADVPLDRPELYQTLVYPRMVHHRGRFCGHLDLLNDLISGRMYGEADFAQRRKMLNIWNLPSMAGLHLADYLLGHGLRVLLVNNLDSEWDLLAEVYGRSAVPPLVGISSTFHLSPKQVGRIARRLQHLAPDVEIVVGGAFVNGLAAHGIAGIEAFMRRYGLRHVLHAFNSETDLRDLLLVRRKGQSPNSIANLATLDRAGAFLAGPSRWNEPVLAEMPALWDRIDAPFVNRTVQIRTASGCPFSCAFCSYPTTAGGWNTLEADCVRAHLDAIARMPGVDRIVFIDDTFNVPQQRFAQLLRILCDYEFEWFSFLRVQYLNDEIARLMADSGCKGVYLGIESASDAVLANMNKKARRADFQRGLAMLNRYGIPSLAAFVLGFPGETEQTIRQNIEFIENEGVTYYSLKEFYYMENTRVHDERERYGLTGMGNRWRHATMDSEQAGRIKLDMFRAIGSSTFIDPDTSLWYLAYLYDQGFDFAEIKALQTEINQLMRAQIDGDFSADHPARARLASLLASRRKPS